jgi:hypothetical protein
MGRALRVEAEKRRFCLSALLWRHSSAKHLNPLYLGLRDYETVDEEVDAVPLTLKADSELLILRRCRWKGAR